MRLATGKDSATKSKSFLCWSEMTVQDDLTLPSTPSEQASKRTKRQAKLTEVFSIGRRSTRSAAKSVTESPLLARKKKNLVVERVEVEVVERVEAEVVEKDEAEVVKTDEAEVVKTDEVMKKVKVENLDNVETRKKGLANRIPVKDMGTEQSVTGAELESTEPRFTNVKDVPFSINESAPVHVDQIPSDNVPIHVDEVELPYTVADLPAVPAYQRFAHLISGPSSLPLPKDFSLLIKILGALDSLCMLNAGRDQPVIFHRALKSLESSVGRRIELNHVRQIHAVFMNEALGNTSSPFKYRSMVIVHDGRRTDTVVFDLPEMATHEYLAGRRAELQRRLILIVSDHHEKFLESINVKLPVGARLKSWHPKYNLESVEALPSMEIVEKVEKVETQVKVTVPKEVKTVLEAIDSHTPVNANSSRDPKAEIVPTSKSSVLERIRVKQREAELSLMTHDPVKEARKKSMEVLLSFSEVVAILFANLNKSSLLLGDALSRIMQGSKSALSSAEVIERLGDLGKIVPDWVRIVTSGTVKTLRIDKSVTLQTVHDQIRSNLADV
jgi:cell wall assembly regulator SMI1